MTGLWNGSILDPPRIPQPPKPGAVKKVPFQIISASWLEIDENVDRAHLRAAFLRQCCKMSERRSSTILAVVERHGDYCGDDLGEVT